MVRYMAAAAALKAFSSPRGKQLYRRIGNSVGSRRRSKGHMPPYYFERVRRMARLAEAHEVVRDGARVLELGTGWLHWEALTLALFWDIEAVLYDVWDNRQLEGLKNYVAQLEGILRKHELSIPPERCSRALSLISTLRACESFDDIYQKMNFRYVVNSEGSLSAFPDAAFDLVVSAGVLEHVRRTDASRLIVQTARVLKGSGWAVHSIDTSDHLAHYDAAVPRKQYLHYTDSVWRRFFENEVQYINRFQRSEWIEVFSQSGFELADEEVSRAAIGDLRPASQYRHLSLQDLECTVLRVALRKHANALDAQ